VSANLWAKRSATSRSSLTCDSAAEFLEDTIAVDRDLNDRWQLAGLLVDSAAQVAIAGRQGEGSPGIGRVQAA
jgi:hypothetical protein